MGDSTCINTTYDAPEGLKSQFLIFKRIDIENSLVLRFFVTREEGKALRHKALEETDFKKGAFSANKYKFSLCRPMTPCRGRLRGHWGVDYSATADLLLHHSIAMQN
jgi:hypothetical protein